MCHTKNLSEGTDCRSVKVFSLPRYPSNANTPLSRWFMGLAFTLTSKYTTKYFEFATDSSRLSSRLQYSYKMLLVPCN